MSREPICSCGETVEDSRHFLLCCHLFEMKRNDLLGQLYDIPGIDILSLDSNSLFQLTSRLVLEATITHVQATKTFS